MDTNLFKHLPGKYKVSWREYYTGQNLSSVRLASAVFFSLMAGIRVLYFIFPLSFTSAKIFPGYNIANWFFIGSSFIFYIVANLLIGINTKTNKTTAIMTLFVFAFSFYLIFCGMYSSLIATPHWRNTLVPYLQALIVIGVLFVLENYEIFILLAISELLFTTLLIRARTDPTEMFYDQIVSAVSLGAFYLVSRYFFSSKANYFLQLMEIREKNLEIEQASEFKNQMLGMVAHDLRNPLAAIESVAMLMEMDAIDADTQENVDLIKTSCVRARTIIEDLLETARNENTKEFVTNKTELNRFIMDIADVWKLQKDAKNIELISNISPAYVQINDEKFQRVMDNLIGNALKYSKDKKKVSIILSKNDNHIIIEVKDNGIGIPKDKLPIIFDQFTKAGRAGLNGEQSTGLGLSIVKQIIEKHNGKIEVESEEGKGSVFRIWLPEGS